MSQQARLRILLAVAIATVAASVFVWAKLASSDERHAHSRSAAAQAMSAGIQDSYIHLQVYADRRSAFDVSEFGSSLQQFENAAAEIAAEGSPAQQQSVARQRAMGSAYARVANSILEDLQRGATRRSTAARQERVAGYVHDFLEENQRYLETVAEDRAEEQREETWIATGLVLGFSALFGLVGEVLLRRSNRQKRREVDLEQVRREQQREFAEALQVTESEDEAYGLIKRHLERSVHGSHVTVMNRNNSRDRLEARTELTDESELAASLLGAGPRSCLAIRLSAPHDRAGGDSSLLVCGVCGALPGRSTCVPSIVGGEVIGSVLVEHPEELTERERVQTEEAVAQAAPALANLRSLALAESRALTDALTGLPNSRAIQDTVKRMVAYASRTSTPLSVVMVDLDHFKSVNDRYGHEKGDEALAAVGDAIAAMLRESDFAGRYGGEEFVVLLPGTEKAGSLEVAEKLRFAVEQIEVKDTDHRLTTSCGVATFPEDAREPEGLLRLADRALYAAKSAGRNRVAQPFPSLAATDPG
jgi:diguanylate cyclase (GGDEF)-like protein